MKSSAFSEETYGSCKPPSICQGARHAASAKRKENMGCISPSAGECNAGATCTALSRSPLSVSRVQPHPSSSPGASHPLQLMWPLLAVISLLTQDKESVLGDIINICALVPALSKLSLSGSANPCKDPSAGKFPFEQDKATHVISHSL